MLGGLSAPEIALAVGGQTDYVIVVPDKPIAQEQEGGEELTHWSSEMTAADFPVVSDAEPAIPTEISVS